MGFYDDIPPNKKCEDCGAEMYFDLTVQYGKEVDIECCPNCDDDSDEESCDSGCRYGK